MSQPQTTSKTTHNSDQQSKDNKSSLIEAATTPQASKEAGDKQRDGGKRATSGAEPGRAKTGSERAIDAGQKLSKECTEILEDFRVGKTTKPTAFMDIYHKLVHAGIEGATLASTIATYQELLESHERLEENALAKGRSSVGDAAGVSRGDPSVPRKTPEVEESQPPGSLDDKTPSTMGPNDDSQHGRRRKAAGKDKSGGSDAGEGDEGEDERDSDTDGGLSHHERDIDTADAHQTRSIEQRKRRKLGDSGLLGNEDELFPWFKRSELRSSTLSPELQKTLAQFLAWADDYKLAEYMLFAATDRPEMPKSEWLRLLRNQAVNLDKVLTSITAIRSDDKYKELVGERITIQIAGDSVPTRRVETHSDWTIAFSRVADAIVYLQPHRQQEVRRYQEYINALFSVHQPYSHKAIINFDQAIRKRVQDRGDLMLSDFASFWDLKDLYLSATGANSGYADSSRSHSGPSGKSRSSTFAKSDDICKRHNDNKCPSKDGRSCRYRHACLQCGIEGHISRDCTNGSKSK